MGIGIKNINLGAKYHEYLKRQVEELGDYQQRKQHEQTAKQDRYQGYLMKGMTDAQIKQSEQDYNSQRLVDLHSKQQDNLNRFTRCSGELAQQWGLSGSLSGDKLETIGKLEMGQDPRTAPFVKVKKVQVHTIKDKSTAHVFDKTNNSTHYLSDDELKQGHFINELGNKISFNNTDIRYLDLRLTKADLKNGYTLNANGDTVYFDSAETTKTNVDAPFFKSEKVKTETIEQRKTATELTFTVDSTFSYAYQMMSDEDKRKFEQIFFDASDKAFNEQVAQHFKNSAGEHGKLLSYDVMHLDGRDGQPHIHIHKDVSNLMGMSDGSISATELDAMKQKGFHQKVDALFKADFVEQFKQAFPNIPVETYDKEKTSVLSYENQRVKDYRVAFDAESLKKIKDQSNIAEQIDAIVNQQQKDENNRFSLAINTLEKQKDSGELSKELFYKKLQKEQQKHERALVGINSTKNKAKIQANIKNAKTDEGLSNKSQRLEDFVAGLGLGYKKDPESIGMVHPKDELTSSTDELIFKNLTATKAQFTSNELICEYVNHYGIDGKVRAEKLIGDAKSWLLGVQAEMTTDMLATFKRDRDGNPTPELLFTSKTLINKEFENLDIMRKQMGQASQMHIKDIDKQISVLEQQINGKFADGQRALIKSVFNENNATIAIGVPGAGKSYAINGCALLAHEQGFKTYGIAPTNKVAGDLGTTAIGKDHAFTVQKFNADFEKGNIKLDATSIVFMDEASMVATHDWNKLLKNIDTSGAKLVVVGDTNQISAVGAGATLTEFMRDKDIIKHQGNIAILDEITRQKDDVSKLIANSTSLAKAYKDGNVDALKASGDHIREAFKILESDSRSNLYDTTQQKIDALVADYMADTNTARDKLVLCSTNESVNNLNDAIQSARLKNGDLSKETLSNGERDFHIGDRIVIKENNKGDKIDRDADRLLFKEFSGLQEQKNAYRDFKSGIVSESDFKEQQKEKFAEFKQRKEQALDQQLMKDFLKTDAQKQAEKDFRNGKTDERTYKENQQVDFERYKIDHGQPLTGGYSNGDVGTIKGFANGKAIVSFDNGSVRTIQIENNNKVDLGYSLTLHKSQGQTVQNSYVFMESSSINSMNLCNVAFTRNKEMLKVYATKGEYNQVKEQYCRQDAKELLTDIGRQYGINPQAQVQQQTISNQADSQAMQVAHAVALQQAPEQQKGFLTTAKEKLLGLFKKAPETLQENGLQSIKDAMVHGSKVAPQKIAPQPQQEPQKQPARVQDIPDAIKAQIARENQVAQQAKAQAHAKAQAELARQQAEKARQVEIAKQQDAQRKKEQAVQAVKQSKKKQKSRGPTLSI
jgi:ATP-dependent exoDNAse (exonuclease V) alpha subunit